MRDETALLAAIRAPADVPGLAERITRADARVAERKDQQARAEQAEEEARQSRAALPDKTQAERFQHAHSQQQRLLGAAGDSGAGVRQHRGRAAGGWPATWRRPTGRRWRPRTRSTRPSARTRPATWPRR